MIPSPENPLSHPSPSRNNSRQRRKNSFTPTHVVGGSFTASNDLFSSDNLSVSIPLQKATDDEEDPYLSREDSHSPLKKKQSADFYFPTVSSWMAHLGLPIETQEKYLKIFETEEIFSIEQVKKLTEKHLHWMGVKVGTILLMMESIERLNEGRFSPPVCKSFPNTPRDLLNQSSSSKPPQENVELSEIHQAGGHLRAITRHKPGFVKKETDAVEANFYTNLSQSKKIPENMKRFFPKLEQIIETPTYLGKRWHVVMEDLTYGYNKACIIDIKMGTRTYAEDTNLLKKKIRQYKDDGTTSSRYGLRITGYRTYNTRSSQFLEFIKESAERITTLDLLENNFHTFFFNGSELRVDVLRILLDHLTVLLGWMETQTSYRFYSSSLLIVYDGQSDQLKVDVRMIDFAHVHEIRDNGIDDGYVKGLKKLIDIFKRLISL